MLLTLVPGDSLSGLSPLFPISKLIIKTTNLWLLCKRFHLQSNRKLNTAHSYENGFCWSWGDSRFFQRMDQESIVQRPSTIFVSMFQTIFFFYGEESGVLWCIIQLWIVKTWREWLALHEEKKRDPNNIRKVTFLQEINWIEQILPFML